MTGRCSFTVLFSGFLYLLCNPVRFTGGGGANQAVSGRIQFTPRADPDTQRRISGRILPRFSSLIHQNAAFPPRYPCKPGRSRHLITQTRQKSAGFAAVTQPSGRTSPVAAFGGITEVG
jgi:hypothetical protein